MLSLRLCLCSIRDSAQIDERSHIMQCTLNGQNVLSISIIVLGVKAQDFEAEFPFLVPLSFLLG